jgi:hypothetical protein
LRTTPLERVTALASPRADWVAQPPASPASDAPIPARAELLRKSRREEGKADEFTLKAEGALIAVFLLFICFSFLVKTSQIKCNQVQLSQLGYPIDSTNHY